jgi:ribosome-binding factor A
MSPAPSHRPEQLASAIREAVQQIIDRGLQDPRVSGLITITGVKVSQDLRNATISVSVMPEEKQNLTLHGLQNAGRHIRREAGELVNIRQLPELSFKLDTSLKKQAAVLEELEKIRKEREAGGHADPTPPLR